MTTTHLEYLKDDFFLLTLALALPGCVHISFFRLSSTQCVALVLQNFWTRLSSKYGTKYYWQERGEGSAIVNAVSAIDTCAREPLGRLQCSKIQGELGEEPSAGPIEKMFLGG